MTGRWIAAALLIAGTACGGGGGQANGDDLPPCPSAAVRAVDPANLPPAFPTPEGVVYTSEQQAGPSTILEGVWSGVELGEAFDRYRTAFPEAGYDVTDEEREAVDAEVNFAGGGTTGQVRLNVRCAGRLEVGITIRPGS